MKLIDRLEATFRPGYKFRPEPITEGGIQMTESPHFPKEGESYKSMRLCRGHYCLDREWDTTSWPIIKDDWRETWSTAPLKDKVLFKGDPKTTRRPIRDYYGTYLKAFDNADAWTYADLKLIEKVFLEFGMTVSFKECCVKPNSK